MPDQTVKVTYTASTDTFTFDPLDASMTAAGKINLHRHPSNADWTFISVNGLPNPPFTSSVNGNGSSIEIDDTLSLSGNYPYTVTVNDATGRHTSGVQVIDSTPPTIMNE